MIEYRPSNERFDPVSGSMAIIQSPRTTHATVIRTGVWKFRPSSGGSGRSGKRKARGYKKGFGWPGSGLTAKMLGGRKKEER